MATLTIDQIFDDELVAEMVEAGMNGVRLNTAHITPEHLQKAVEHLHEIAPEQIILVDTKGPEVRTYSNHNDLKIFFSENEKVRIVCSRKNKVCTHKTIYINADRFPEDLQVDQYITIGDGALDLYVREVISSTEVEVEVQYDGILEPRQTVSLGALEFPDLESVTSRDRKHIEAAIACGVNIIAHSYVRNADDVKAVREIVGDSGPEVWAKIETGSAVQNMSEILNVSDGALIARGDLGNAVSPYFVPVVQRMVADMCSKRNKPVMMCTQILESMINSPTPTRAEVSDAFTSCNCDMTWQLLCGETAKGDYPVECVTVLNYIIDTYERLTTITDSDQQ